MASHSPENILRRLIITEMEGIAQYKDLMVYLNSEERKVINEIIKDENGVLTIEIDTDKCIKCGVCISSCKFGAIIKE